MKKNEWWCWMVFYLLVGVIIPRTLICAPSLICAVVIILIKINRSTIDDDGERMI